MPIPEETLQAEIDGLYALPLDEFTPTRDELARRLRSEGDRDASAAVKRLRKPNLIAWALNYVRHRDPALIDGLIEGGEGLQEAQQQLVAGGERGVLRDAVAEERRLVDEVVARAEQELHAAGHPVSATVQSKLWATVHAAAVIPDPRDLLRAGRLLRDYEVSDLGLMGAGPAAVALAAVAPAATREPPKEVARESGERKEAERQARSIRRELERARGQQEKLAAKRDDARRRTNEAARQAARAQAELERAQAALEQADARAHDADERVRGLEAELDELER
jgi:hypothetical protein